MKVVAVLGGGPAGASAAERLAGAGLRTIIIDEKLAWEKPCGGGITYKAYSQYPYLIENDTPKKMVTDTLLAAPKSGVFKMALTRPLVIYSRIDLNGMLLRRAEAAGAEIEKERVMGLDRNGSGWRIRTRSSRIDADYCVVATGARNPLRDVGTQYTAEDTMYALGYWVPSDRRISTFSSCRIWKVIFGCSRERVIFRWASAGRVNRRSAFACGWNGTWTRRAFAGEMPDFTGTCCPRWDLAAGGTTAWRAMAGSPWAMPED